MPPHSKTRRPSRSPARRVSRTMFEDDKAFPVSRRIRVGVTSMTQSDFVLPQAPMPPLRTAAEIIGTAADPDAGMATWFEVTFVFVLMVLLFAVLVINTQDTAVWTDSKYFSFLWDASPPEPTPISKLSVFSILKALFSA